MAVPAPAPSIAPRIDAVAWWPPARRLALGLALPVVALGLQWALWDYLQPYVWFLFYPTVFFAAVLAGLEGGIAATMASTLLVWHVFMPPPFSFALTRGADAFSLVVFAITGAAFSVYSWRAQHLLRQRAALAAEREGQRAYRQLFDNTMDGIMLTEPSGAILAANPAAQRIFGCDEDEIRRLGRRGLIDPADPRGPPPWRSAPPPATSSASSRWCAATAPAFRPK